MSKRIAVMLLLAFNLGQSAVAQSTDDRLPDLGDVTASVYSKQQEYQLGRMWLKQFRSQVKTLPDPLMADYIESLIHKLAANSELKDTELETVVVDNPTINAFAVPGGVVGVHSGLFLNTENEAQLASVLAHELAHLSQRHFSRSLAKARESSIPTLAGLLAGIVLAATAGGDAGIAAISATQAAALQNQLRFSRQNEQEADRIGMDTLVRADMDPNAVPAMFAIMNERLRFAQAKPPEFLLTHPLTDNRVSDSKNRARQYPRKIYTDNLNFQLMKVRAELHHSKDSKTQLTEWRREQGANGEARHYGITLALIDQQQWDQAQQQLGSLLDNDGGRIAYQLAQADILLGRGQLADAIDYLTGKLELSPGNNPLTMKLAEAFQKANRFAEADALLTAQSKRRPNDPELWYQLAEVRGLNRNILGVHQARAEYFILVGQFGRARVQLQYAYKLTENNRVEQGRIRERLRDVENMRQLLEQL